MQIRNELIEKLVNAKDNEEVVFIIISGPGVQVSDWRQVVDVQEINDDAVVILFEGNMEVYLGFDELNIEYVEEDDEYCLESKGTECEVSLRMGL